METYTSHIYTIEEIIEKTTPIFKERGVIRAVLFGSYAKGEATSKSDVDIVAYCEDWVSGLDLCGIGGEIMEKLNKSVDFFDIEELKPNSNTEKEINNTGKVIYEKNKEIYSSEDYVLLPRD